MPSTPSSLFSRTNQSNESFTFLNESNTSNFWWTFAYYIHQSTNLLIIYNLPFISLIRWIIRNSKKVGIEKWPIIYYNYWLILILIIHTIVIIFVPIDKCESKKAIECYKVMVIVIFNSIKIILSIVLLILSRQIPNQEISQLKFSIKNKDNSLTQVLMDENILSNYENKFFFLEIDKKQAINENNDYCHVLRMIYKERVQRNEKNQEFTILDSIPNKNGLKSSYKNSTYKSSYAYGSSIIYETFQDITKELFKTEDELISLALELKHVLRFNAHKSLFMSPDNQNLDLNVLENLVNTSMNEFKTSIVVDDVNEKCCQLISKFLGINWINQFRQLWLKDFSLSAEFPQIFTLSSEQSNVLFSRYIVTAFKKTNKINVFKVNVHCVSLNEYKKIVVTLNEIESFCSNVFPEIDLNFNTKNLSFKKEITYLMNVCLNEIQDLEKLSSFLGFENKNLTFSEIEIPKTKMTIEPVYSKDSSKCEYKISLEFVTIGSSIVQIVRSFGHFQVLSNNFELRFSEDFAFDLNKYENLDYVKKWLSMLLGNSRIWKSSEFRIFIQYFNVF